MSEITVIQSTDYIIKDLTLTLTDGVTSFDLQYVFVELNLYDNIFTPCASGNIIISESVGLSEKLKFKGKEKIRVKLDKTTDEFEPLSYEKEFVVYKISNRTNDNFTSQTYVLHFVSEEQIKSERKKISQKFKGLFSNFVKTILTNSLGVKNDEPKQGKAGIGLIHPSYGQQTAVVPYLKPFEAINWICKRAISTTFNKPDFLFFETHKTGYRFVPLSGLYELPSLGTINFNPKNIQTGVKDEFFGARSFTILSQYDYIDTIRNGTLGGKIIAFDYLTNTVTVINQPTENEEDIDSKITTVLYQSSRRNVEMIKKDSPDTINFLDDIESYIIQRKAIFAKFLQRRIQIVLPGNFSLYSGAALTLKIPKYTSKEENQTVEYDETLSGKYIITGTRHIIRPDKHETIIELSTDRLGITEE